jgi:hypothetical protein
MEMVTTSRYRPVELLSGASAYFGGKRFLAVKIIEHIQKIEQLRYAESFIGMGGRNFHPPVV